MQNIIEEVHVCLHKLDILLGITVTSAVDIYEPPQHSCLNNTAVPYHTTLICTELDSKWPGNSDCRCGREGNITA